MRLTTNEIIYKIQKALSLSHEEIIKAYGLEGYEMTKDHLESLLKRSQDNSFMIATYEELGIFLDGLVTLRRGSSPVLVDEEVLLTNNLILKKLRIALDLKEYELRILFALADVELTKQQLASLFRKENHKNFKPCSDELLGSFLNGLDEFYFAGNELE